MMAVTLTPVLGRPRTGAGLSLSLSLSLRLSPHAHTLSPSSTTGEKERLTGRERELREGVEVTGSLKRHGSN